MKPGATNRLEVTVAKHSANESVNNAERLADYWVFGGIYRPVYLEAVPPQFIERVAIDARHDGAFAMDVFANGITSADAEMVLEAQITDLDGKTPNRPAVPRPTQRQQSHAQSANSHAPAMDGRDAQPVPRRGAAPAWPPVAPPPLRSASASARSKCATATASTSTAGA